MRELLQEYDSLSATGEAIGRAVVTEVWGSAPQPEGACMLTTAGGRIAGSVSGGCVESATATEITETIRRGTPKLVSFGVSNETAWEVGLACGGTIRVWVEPRVRPEILEAARGPGGVVIATVVEGPGTGSSWVIPEDRAHDSTIPASVIEGAHDALAREASRTIELAGQPTVQRVFLEVFPRRPRLVIFGGVHIAAELVRLARPLGYETIVADGRQAFLTRERFPDADQLVLAWPEEAFQRIGLDRATYVCLLSHDPKFDEPALRIALQSPAPYVGAIGSRKTQLARRDRLRLQGFSDQQIARLRGPIGLDLGGRRPAETALAILAEITAVRFRGTGRVKSEA